MCKSSILNTIYTMATSTHDYISYKMQSLVDKAILWSLFKIEDLGMAASTNDYISKEMQSLADETILHILFKIEDLGINL